VHLGAGAFFRAHQACYAHAVAAAGHSDWGIMATSQRSSTVADQLSAQDGLYSVLERPTRGAAKADVVGVIRRTASAAREPEDIVDALADPTVHVVTHTVTEKGYRAAGGRLKVDSDVEADLSGRPPLTVVGQLVRGLQKRASAGAGPITLISCDNLSDNGTILGRLVRDFSERLSEPGADVVREFIEQHTTFPSTMVDRIVPATADSDRAEVRRLLGGVRDDAAVVAEPFSQWVIADQFAGPRPPWEDAGAILTTDVAGYERVKLRLLNATHSLIAYLGALAGYTTIAEALADAQIEHVARRLIDDDQMPTLTAPDGLDLFDYRETVLERFANPALGHRTAQVAMDGSQKLPQRILSAVRERRADGAVPAMGALLIAAWMRFLAGRDDHGNPLEVSDPMAERLVPSVSRSAPARDIVRDVFSVREIFGADLGDDAPLVDAVTHWFEALRQHGVEDTLKGS
jgi:fructuronate reductase